MAKCRLSIHTAKDPGGLDCGKWASGSDFASVNPRAHPESSTDSWKIDMITVCLDSSIQWVVSIPSSITWNKTKKLTHLYQFQKESVESLGNFNILSFKPALFFPFRILLHTLFSFPLDAIWLSSVRQTGHEAQVRKHQREVLATL